MGDEEGYLDFMTDSPNPAQYAFQFNNISNGQNLYISWGLFEDHILNKD